MQIACPTCKKAFSLDDAKVPDHPFAVKCPSCQGRIAVAPPPRSAAPAEHPQSTPEMPAAPQPSSAKADATEVPAAMRGPEWERLRKEVTFELLKSLGIKAPMEMVQGEDGYAEAPMALVCDDEALFQEAIREALAKLGYKVDVAPSVQVATELLRKQTYEIATVDNRFPDDPDGGFRILQEINGLAPDRRRKMFVAFVSADLNTMDTNSAFILGANLTVSKKDVKRIERILVQGRVEHERLYRVFHQVREEIEKADA